MPPDRDVAGISLISPNLHVGLESLKTRFSLPGAHVFKDADSSHTPTSQMRVMCCSVIGAAAIHGSKEQGAFDVGETGKSSPL